MVTSVVAPVVPITPVPAVLTVPKAWSLHIGLNAVDPVHYGGWDGVLSACEFDAYDMAAVAASRGMTRTLLLTKQATRAKVLAALRKAAKALKSGDLFFLTYSGHGGQVPDTTGEEADRMDETWCLYDSQLIDDELYLELSRFAAGVRILVLSDSCHSGSVVRAVMPGAGGPVVTVDEDAPRPRAMPVPTLWATYKAHKQLYDRRQKAVSKAVAGVVVDPDVALAGLVNPSVRVTAIAQVFNPAVILISGCQDNQTSMDGARNGAFTGRLLQVWNNGTYNNTASVTYTKFHALIRAGMPATQTPNLFTLGSVTSFLKQKPFTV